NTVAVGDRVLWKPSEGGLGCVVEVLARRSLLTRPARGMKTRAVVANLDQILVVFAPQPPCDLLLLDQYLVISENRGLRALLICNKADLVHDSEQLDQVLALYETIGYPVIRVSAKSGFGVEQLKNFLKGQTSMLVGQSGVGKSSLTKVLVPDKHLSIGDLSRDNRHGKHTTTTTTLFHLPDGGDLIDSPGVAIFGLAETTEQDLAFGYREFQPFLGRCRFNDCRHVKDTGCAIRAALDQGIIHPRRYERFLKLREKLPD
ncbi:MAG: ribosome small subunit-dependent GTPase A, partial [Gammaproteobacteria bacterium]